ncbi:MAG: 3-dehydroquinate synthase, partial [Bacteroidales bacterium]
MQLSINNGISNSLIIIGADWKEAFGMTGGSDFVIVTDMNVSNFYKDDYPDVPVLVISPGESSKSLSYIGELGEELLRLGADRKTLLIGVGGGVVSDITGFLASIYMRGIRFGFVSTSLLSQVDASVGGKNGVNLAGTKNVLGTFTQPEFVICDPRMLSTLPDDEYLSGLAELIKMAAILDENLFTEIENNKGLLIKRDSALLADFIGRAVKLKADVVTRDEKEIGPRRILNFGHTFGHAIETGCRVKHGFAVASGMVLAAKLSVSEGLLAVADSERLINMLGEFNLLLKYELSESELRALVSHDKKKEGSNLNFILLDKIGSAVIKQYSLDYLIDWYK